VRKKPSNKAFENTKENSKGMKVSAPSRKLYRHTKSELKGKRGNDRGRENGRKRERD